MNRKILAAAGLAFAATAISAPVQAGPFDKLKKKVEKVKKEAKEVQQAARAVEATVDAVKDGRAADVAADAAVGAAVKATTGRTSTRLGSPLTGVRAMDGSVPGGRNYPKRASRGNYAGRAPAAPAKYASMTQCADLNVGNAFIAQAGNYTFTTGLKTETRGGLIERESVSPANGCIFPGLGVGDVLYVEVDRNGFNKHEYEVQCVSFDGSKEVSRNKAEIGPRANNYTGKDVMLHTGHSLGYTPTAAGSNSDRSGAYDKYLAGRGRAMITFNMPEQHNDKSGTDFYCQYYNNATGKSAVAFTYRRGPVGRS